MARGVEEWRDGPGGGGRTEPRAPMVNAPPIVTFLVGIIFAAFLIAAVLPPAQQALVYFYGSVSPPRILHGRGIAALPAHMLLHDGIVHVGLNSVWLLAFGAPVARRMGADTPARAQRRRSALAFAALFVASGIFGALFFVALHPTEASYLMGASGGVSGLLGALVRFGMRGPTSTRALHEMSRLWDAPVLVWSTVIIGLNLFFGVFSGALGFGESKIAWEAHVGGYIFGLLAFPAFLAMAHRDPR